MHILRPFPKLSIFARLFTVGVLIAAASEIFAQEVEIRSLVFNKYDEGSQFYRIPALACDRSGALVAFADKRYDSLQDLPSRIDVVCRRSEDGGHTWGTPVTVAAADSVGGYGDPAVGLDPQSGDILCVMTHGNGLWKSTAADHASIVVCRSSDGGHTWSAPADITEMLFSQIEPRPEGAFASSGAMAATSDGSMMFVLVVKDQQKKWAPLKVYACRSNDGGLTWQVASMPADTDGDEAKIVELSDGRLLMSIRNRRKGAHKFSVSSDKGITWSSPQWCDDIMEPGCNGDIIRMPDGRLILSIPADAASRRDISMFESLDSGESWKKVLTLCPAPSAYSSMVLMPDGAIGILTEENACDDGFRIWFNKVSGFAGK